MVVVRIVLGLALVLLALWIIVGEQLAGVTADATVNARVATVRAPIAGELEMAGRELGARVARGEVLGTVTDPLVDAVRLDDLEMELALEAAAIARHATMVAETEAIVADLETRAETFGQRRVAEIETRLVFARARLRLLEDGVFPAAFDIAPPADAGIERAAEPDAEGLRELWINAVSERIAVLENELAAAQAWVFLGDGYNDAPNAGQRLVELRSEIAGHAAARAEAEARHAAVAARIEAERLRTNRAGLAELVSPADGPIWEVMIQSGVTLQRGDPVLRVLDCTSVIVTASVTEQVYNDLTFGAAAVFRPAGDDRNLDATVIRLAGAGAGTIYGDLAVAPSERHLQRYDVTLSVPGLEAQPDLACAVGRTGRVFFDRRPMDWLRGLWD